MDIDLTYVWDLVTNFFSIAFAWVPTMTANFWTILERYVGSLLTPDREFGGGGWVLLIVLVMTISATYIYFRYRR